jgi:hypothetical protein
MKTTGTSNLPIRLALVLLPAGCGLITVNGKPLGTSSGASSSSSSSSAASSSSSSGAAASRPSSQPQLEGAITTAPPSHRVTDPVGELNRRRAAEAAKEPHPPPLKQASIPANLSTKPMIVDAEIAPSDPMSKRWDLVGNWCAEAMARAPLVEFEINASTPKYLVVALNEGIDGMLIEQPDGSALLSCAQSDREAPALGRPKDGWAPGRYRVYLTAGHARSDAQEVEVRFSVHEPERPPLEAWTDNCFADYKDFRAKWGPIEAKTRKELAAIDGSDFYRDYPKLVKLYLGLAKQMAELKINAGVNYEHTQGMGIALEVHQALTALQVRHHRDYQEALPFQGNVAHLLTGDDEFDRNVYCYEATGAGSPRVQPLYSWGNLKEPWWLKRPQLRDFFERYNKLVAAGHEAAAFKPGRQVEDDGGYVSSITHKGSDTVFVVETYDSRQDCRSTDRVSRINPDGRVEYEVVCSGKWNTSTSRRKVVIATALLPKTPEIKLKDDVAFYVDPDTLKADTPSRAFSVRSIERNEKKIADWALYVEKDQK